MKRLEGKVAIVTASNKGIGYACVKRLAEEGATVYMAARRIDVVKEKCKELCDQGLNVKPIYWDAEVKERNTAMVDEVAEAEGRLDILVNNYGHSDIRVDKDIHSTNYADFEELLNYNIASVFMTSQAAIKHMAKCGGGSIINISSVGGTVPDISQITYGVAKASINYLTQLIAIQCARENIRCNAVAPGMTATDAVMNNLTPAFMEFFLKHTPIKRMATPEEVAGTVAYLASDDGAFTTGQIIGLDGGFGQATPVFGDMIAMREKR